MDDMGIGHHCAVCQKKDFFSFQCPSCQNYYCGDHRHVTCTETPLNIDHESIQTSKVMCNYYTYDNDSKPIVCPKEGFSKCPFCQQQYCVAHRFEDQHNCTGLKQIEEIKQEKEESKQAILDKIKAKSEVQKSSFSGIFGKETSDKQKKISKTVQRIKTKQSAKGDPKLPKDKRYAVTLEASDTVKDGVTFSTAALYFDRNNSVGQVLDQICKATGFKQVKDYNNVNESQIYVCYEKDDTLCKLDFEIKIGELSKLIEGFDQGDTLYLVRGNEL